MSLSVEQINKLEQENRELRAYKNVMEKADWQGHCEQLKKENDKLRDEVSYWKYEYKILDNCIKYLIVKIDLLKEKRSSNEQL